MLRTVLLATSLCLGSMLAGCSSPCDALADLCKKCKDANTKTSCDDVVAAYKSAAFGGGTGCQAVLDANTYKSCE